MGGHGVALLLAGLGAPPVPSTPSSLAPTNRHGVTGDPGPLGGIDGFKLSQVQQAKHRSIPAIIFVKTHKTASSTIANLFNRMADWRGMRVMTPPDDRFMLNWPNEFPGERDNEERPQHQYGLISAHAVFSPAMIDWVWEKPKVITILREPVSRWLSMWDYNNAHLGCNNSGARFEAKVKTLAEAINASLCDGRPAWAGPARSLSRQVLSREHPSGLGAELFPEATRPHKTTEEKCAEILDQKACGSGQLMDLGYYHSDPPETGEAFDDLLRKMEEQFDLVMIVEELPKSLILLQELLDLPLQELITAELKSNEGARSTPTPEQMEVLREASFLDTQLYNHFDRSLARKWERAEARRGKDVLQEKLESLQRQTDSLHAECDRKGSGCPMAFRADWEEDESSAAHDHNTYVGEKVGFSYLRHFRSREAALGVGSAAHFYP